MSKEDFYDLTPDQVLNAVERSGFNTTGEFTQLNSYENRVFDVRLENIDRVKKESVIVKFYRPGRWNENTILEEHLFLDEIYASGIPAVAPLKLKNHKTLDIDNHIWFALWPKAYGRMVDELNHTDLSQLGRTLARLHNIGEQSEFKFRPIMNCENYGWQNLDLLKDWIAPEVRPRYLNAAENLLYFLDENLNEDDFIRIHGDCHRGNILKTDRALSAVNFTTDSTTRSEFFFVDFDDCAMGHPIQDFWMLLSDNEKSETGMAELAALIDGYEEFRQFNDDSLSLIPAFRGLRIIHYAAWICKRWEDPSFPQLFPQFRDFNYWATETEALERISNSL